MSVSAYNQIDCPLKPIFTIVLVSCQIIWLVQFSALGQPQQLPGVRGGTDTPPVNERFKEVLISPNPHFGIVQAETLGLPSEFTGDATAKFNAALSMPGIDTVTFCGRYIVNGVIVPPGKRLEGCNMSRATLLGTSGNSDFVVSVSDGSSLARMTINGNAVLDKGVAIKGDSVRISEVSSMYSDKCFYNEKGNVSILIGNLHNDCHYGFYSADNWVNSVIMNHIGANGSNTNGSTTPSYGFYWTYEKQQPQAIRLTSSQSYGDAYGIYFKKDAYAVSIRDVILDGIGAAGITFDTTPCVTKNAPSNVFISGSYITGVQAAVRFRARGPNCASSIQAYNQLVIRENQLVGNIGIAVEANSRSRSANITISDNSFTAGPSPSTAIFLDSPYGAWIERNSFALDPNIKKNPGVDIQVGTSFSGVAYSDPVNPPIEIRFNRFEKPGRRVSPSNVNLFGNIGSSQR